MFFKELYHGFFMQTCHLCSSLGKMWFVAETPFLFKKKITLRGDFFYFHLSISFYELSFWSLAFRNGETHSPMIPSVFIFLSAAQFCCHVLFQRTLCHLCS
uniref:Uncharacterized protein n=1 Tax=Anguilla anguilla TaxID=7936 RepID=A0A0E9WML7_ANGAN